MKASVTTLLHDPTLKYKVVHVPKKNPGMRAQRTIVVYLHAFLTSALYVSECNFINRMFYPWEEGPRYPPDRKMCKPHLQESVYMPWRA
jgi:hypothetical protein